jgi:hypothetical protein
VTESLAIIIHIRKRPRMKINSARRMGQ